MTCWRRLRDWQAAGVWARLHRVLLDRQGKANAIDWSRACIDSASFAAKGGEATGPTPTDRGRPGSRRQLLVDGNGLPLALLLSAANRHDSRLLEPLIEAVPPVRRCAGRPRKRPAELHADKGYDFAHGRRLLRRRGIAPRIARRGKENSEKLERHRWIIGRTLAWFSRCRRLAIRYERCLDILQGFHLLAASLICLRFVTRWSC